VGLVAKLDYIRVSNLTFRGPYIVNDSKVQPTRRNVTQFISENYSTCFGRFLHPSSGAQNYIYSIWYLSKCNELSLKITNNVYVRALKYGKLKTNWTRQLRSSEISRLKVIKLTY